MCDKFVTQAPRSLMGCSWIKLGLNPHNKPLPLNIQSSLKKRKQRMRGGENNNQFSITHGVQAHLCWWIKAFTPIRARTVGFLAKYVKYQPQLSCHTFAC